MTANKRRLIVITTLAVVALLITTGAVFALGTFSFVGGGQNNTAEGDFATVGAGDNNAVNGNYSSILGGQNNTANGNWSAIGGGKANKSKGNYATVSGGRKNTAPGRDATVGGGRSNAAKKTASTVSGGQGNLASGNFSTVGAGVGNTARGFTATIGGGSSNLARGVYSSVPGGRTADARLYGQMAYASGAFAFIGDAQASLYVLRNTTTDDTNTELFLNGASIPITLHIGRTLLFDMLVVGIGDDGLTFAAYEILGLIQNRLGTTVLEASSTNTLIESDGALDVSVAADDVNDALVVTVTGLPATNMRWVANVRTAEVAWWEQFFEVQAQQQSVPSTAPQSDQVELPPPSK